MAESFLSLRVSKDGGYTWSDWSARSLGDTGAFAVPAIWRRLGNSEHFTFQFRADGAPDLVLAYVLDASGQWVEAPLGSGAYADHARLWTFQDTVNYIPVRVERPDATAQWILRGAPGCRLFANVGDGPIRGKADVEGKLIVVSGTGVYRVNRDTSATLLGTLPGEGRVTITHNQEGGGSKVVFANGTRGYTYDTITGVYAQITDEAFPGFLVCDYLDQYILGIEPQRRYAFHSDLANAREYSTIDVFEAEGAPDRLMGQAVIGGQWWLFGERTTEIFVNTGAATGTFQRMAGATIDRGLASTHAVAKLDNALWILGDDGIVYRSNGYSFVRMSTHALEQALRLCDMTQVFFQTFEDAGHKILYVTCPDGRTWGFDVATQEWARRESFGLSRWRMSTLTKWAGVWMMGDFQTGKVYQLDWSIKDEDGTTLTGGRTTGALVNRGNRFTVSGVKVVCDTGRGEEALTGVHAIIDPLVIYNPLPQTYVGTAVSHSYLATGGVRPYVFSIVAGTLPAGLSMDSAGLVTGTPTTLASYAWRVQVQDAQGFTATLEQGVNASLGIDGGATYMVSDQLPALITDRDFYEGDPAALTLFRADVWAPTSPVYRSISSSPGGDYICCGLATTPFVQIRKYNIATDAYDTLPNPATLPPASVSRTLWHPSGNYLYCNLGNDASRFIIYSRSGDTFTPIAAPATLPSAITFSAAWSPDGDKLAVCTTDSASTVYLYPFISGALGSPSSVAGAVNLNGADIEFSHDSLWIAAGGNQGLEVFDAGGAVISLFDSVATAPDCARGTNWSSNDGYIYTLASVADGVGNRLAVYTFNGAAVAAADAIQFGNFPASQPSAGSDSAITADGLYLAVAEADTQLKVYGANTTGDQLTLVATQPPVSSGNLKEVEWTNFARS